jgi:hypothetical protein
MFLSACRSVLHILQNAHLGINVVLDSKHICGDINNPGFFKTLVRVELFV